MVVMKKMGKMMKRKERKNEKQLRRKEKVLGKKQRSELEHFRAPSTAIHAATPAAQHTECHLS